MADKNFYVIDQNTGGLFPIKLDDNGDGTYSVAISSSGSSAAPTDGATNPSTGLSGYNGTSWDKVRVQSFRVDLNAVTITSIATVWTPTSGKKFRLMGGSFSISAPASVLFEDNSAGAGNFVWRTPKLAADSPYSFDLGNGKVSAAIDQVLKATSSAAATITGTLYGVEE